MWIILNFDNINTSLNWTIVNSVQTTCIAATRGKIGKTTAALRPGSCKIECDGGSDGVAVAAAVL